MTESIKKEATNTTLILFETPVPCFGQFKNDLSIDVRTPPYFFDTQPSLLDKCLLSES